LSFFGVVRLFEWDFGIFSARWIGSVRFVKMFENFVRHRGLA